MRITLEKIIEIVTKEVVAELLKKGIEISTTDNGANKVAMSKPIEIDMTAFKTPVLTQNALLELGKEVHEIIIPAKTVITPGAGYIIKKNTIKITYKH